MKNIHSTNRPEMADRLAHWVETGQIDAIHRQLKVHPEQVFKEDTYGRSLVAVACVFGRVHVLKYLLSIDPAGVDRRDNHGITPLHFTMNPHGELCFEVLIAANPKTINTLDKYGRSILTLAASCDGWCPIERLIALGCTHINTVDLFGDTPLSKAVNHPAKFQTLLSLGADLNVALSGGRNMLHAAIRCCPTIELILNMCHDMLLKYDDGGCTPFERAAEIGYVPAVELMLHWCNLQCPGSAGRLLSNELSMTPICITILDLPETAWQPANSDTEFDQEFTAEDIEYIQQINHPKVLELVIALGLELTEYDLAFIDGSEVAQTRLLESKRLSESDIIAIRERIYFSGSLLDTLLFHS